MKVINSKFVYSSNKYNNWSAIKVIPLKLPPPVGDVMTPGRVLFEPQGCDTVYLSVLVPSASKLHVCFPHVYFRPK